MLNFKRAICYCILYVKIHFGTHGNGRIQSYGYLTFTYALTKLQFINHSAAELMFWEELITGHCSQFPPICNSDCDHLSNNERKRFIIYHRYFSLLHILQNVNSINKSLIYVSNTMRTSSKSSPITWYMLYRTEQYSVHAKN